MAVDQVLAAAGPEQHPILEQQRVQLQQSREQLGTAPTPLQSGETLVETVTSGGQSIFWQGGISPLPNQPLADSQPQPVGPPQRIDDQTTRQILAYPAGVQLRGNGDFRLDFLLYKLFGMKLTTMSDAMLSTLELPPKIVSPFLVMILLSWITRPNSPRSLDRYYAKMRTPADPDPDRDHQRLEEAYANPAATIRQKLFPSTQLEFQRPTWIDVSGFFACFVACFAIIGLAVWVAGVGG